MLKEVIDSLQLKSGMNVIDCTLGDGGHAEAMLEKIGPKGKLLGIDADPESLLSAKQYLYMFGDRVIFARDNFARLKKIATETGFDPAPGILMDLGWSSSQFEERGRGFSFEKDEPLEMRYQGKNQMSNDRFQIKSKDQISSSDITAAEIVNTYDFDDLYRIFRQYGEEDLSREIADAIIEARNKKKETGSKIETTKELSEIILRVYRKKLGTDKEIPWIGGLHPATKVFQALRIEVNRELEALKQALPQALEVLAPAGRLAVITFHSLEDRIVKHYFQSVESAAVRVITKKPIIASDQEIQANPRARSAKLRVIEKN